MYYAVDLKLHVASTKAFTVQGACREVGHRVAVQRIRPDPSRWSFGEDASNLAAEEDLAFREKGLAGTAAKCQLPAHKKRRKPASIIVDVVEERGDLCSGV